MKQYFLVINGEKSGPFTIDQLATQQLTPQTLVWTEGMSDWAPAQQFAELSSLFAPQAPSAPTPEAPQPTATPQAPAYNAAPAYGNPQPQAPNTQVAPPNYLVWSILATLFCCIPGGVIAIVYSTQVSSRFQQGDYAGALASSRNARKWVMISAITALSIWVIYFIIIAITGASSLALNDF